MNEKEIENPNEALALTESLVKYLNQRNNDLQGYVNTVKIKDREKKLFDWAFKIAKSKDIEYYQTDIERIRHEFAAQVLEILGRNGWHVLGTNSLPLPTHGNIRTEKDKENMEMFQKIKDYNSNEDQIMIVNDLIEHPEKQVNTDLEIVERDKARLHIEQQQIQDLLKEKLGIHIQKV